MTNKMQTPPSATQVVPSEFDDILSAPVAQESSKEGSDLGSSSHGLPLHASHADAPTFGEFVDSWYLYRDPVLAAVFAGVVLGVLGVFVVLRRAVFVTAAVSQSAGLGVALAFLLAIQTGVELPPVLFAFVFAGLGALTFAVRPPVGLPREAVVGLVYLLASSLSILVGDRISQEAHDISSILFGSAVLVTRLDLCLVASVGAVALVFILILARALVFAGLDPDAARVQRVPVRTLEGILWFMVSAEVAVSTRALGALSVFAFAVLPALGALHLSRRLPQALWLGGIFGAFSGGAGYLAAFLFELPVGASQAVTAATIALGCFLSGKIAQRLS